MWANDSEPQVEKTYRKNFPTNRFILGQIEQLDFNDLEPVDVIHAGFPCQSFSIAGNRRGFDDPKGRGRMFDIMFSKLAVAKWQPRILVFENAPFIKNGNRGAWFQHIKIKIQRAGYWFNTPNAFIVDTHKHAGLPQHRKRLFMVATNMKYFDHNPFVGLPETNSRLSLDNMLDIGKVNDKRYFLDTNNRFGKLIYETGEKLNKGQLLQLRKTIVRPQPPGVCPTLTANMGLGGHNVPFLIDKTKLRKLTERECLRLQGFDEKFEFPDIPSSAQYRMIGNSVSPMVSNLMAAKIKNTIIAQ